MRRPGILTVTLLAALLSGPGPAAGCPLHLPTASGHLGRQMLRLELAATPAARQCGLSRRDRLPPGRGMLFIFDGAVRLPFWMKDTRIPLSIAFLDGTGRILHIADLAPEDLTLVQPPDAYRYALELPQGWFSAHGVGPGDRLDLPDDLSSQAEPRD